MKTKINLSAKSEQILSSIKSKYMIRPNIICRYAIMLSLKIQEEPETCKDNSGREFNRTTLTGDDDLIIRELIKKHHGSFISDNEYMETYLKAHLERGFTILSNNIAQSKSFDNYLMQLIMNGDLL